MVACRNKRERYQHEQRGCFDRSKFLVTVTNGTTWILVVYSLTFGWIGIYEL